MKLLPAKALILLASLAFSGTAASGDSFWVGAKIGTLGLGIEGTWRPIDWMDLRVGGNAYTYNETGSLAGIDYNAALKLNTYYATANFRFPLSPFRVTAGLYSNQNRIEMVSVESQSYDIGGVLFSADDVGTLIGTTSFDSSSPYIGAGFDFSIFGQVGLNLDFGVLWQGDPRVDLSTDGLLADDPTFQGLLAAESAQLEDEVAPMKAYPVISLGLNFNF
jgi:hypothetical protein